MDIHNIINTFDNNKIIYRGSLEQCKKYIQGHNVYGYNYSKLKIT